MTLGARQRAEEEDEAEEEEEGSRVMSPVQASPPPPQETLPEEELSCCRGGSINTVCDGTTDCVLNVGEGGFWYFQREMEFFFLILLFSGTFATLCVLGKSDSSNFQKKKKNHILTFNVLRTDCCT